MSKLILFGGKGGVGKTTTSAAVAIWTASQGLNTLVVSSDPAHSLGDSFGRQIGNVPTPIVGVANLWAVEMDPRQTMAKLAPKLTEALANPLKALGIDEELDMSGDDMMLPGLDEALAFDFLLRFVESQDYDIIIFDTAPTGHTLRFLSLPNLTDRWISRMMRFRDQLTKLKSLFIKKKDTGLEVLEQFKRRVEHIRRFLANEKFTSFYIVLIPELLAVEESRRAKTILASYGIPVKGAVVNNIVPENDACRLCQSRHRSQMRHLTAIRKEFAGLQLAEVPVFDTEIHGIESLQLVSAKIMGERQLDIQGKKSLEKEYDAEEGIFHVRLFYPETQKSDLQLKTQGNILNITLYGVTSMVEVPFKVDPKKVQAQFMDDYLNITVQR
ncbi:MAG: TRC40/GET3/ArsA family transport-energizing ATPase [Deltaproteobacteria bacterium]|nr:TRC40/GET3/ArsA family transport-energizing ATPase [Deltaproteobacteria bacterium]